MRKQTKSRKKIKLSAKDINRIMDRMYELAQSPTNSNNEIITLAEMAKILELSPTTLKKYVLNNEVPGHFAGNKKIYFLRSDFNAGFFTNDGMLTCEDVATKMQITPRTVRRWITNGILAGQKVGKKWWINYNDYLDFLELGVYNHE